MVWSRAQVGRRSTARGCIVSTNLAPPSQRIRERVRKIGKLLDHISADWREVIKPHYPEMEPGPVRRIRLSLADVDKLADKVEREEEARAREVRIERSGDTIFVNFLHRNYRGRVSAAQFRARDHTIEDVKRWIASQEHLRLVE